MRLLQGTLASEDNIDYSDKAAEKATQSMQNVLKHREIKYKATYIDQPP